MGSGSATVDRKAEEVGFRRQKEHPRQGQQGGIVAPGGEPSLRGRGTLLLPPSGTHWHTDSYHSAPLLGVALAAEDGAGLGWT